MKRQAGATMIEFALVLVIFLAVMLGIIDFARMLWTWNAASEATRWGARTAAICDQDTDAVLGRMQAFLPQLEASNVIINWYTWSNATSTYSKSTTCDASSCAGVNVQITGLKYQWIGPIAYGYQATFDFPELGFSTFLPRESMGLDEDSDEVCVAP